MAENSKIEWTDATFNPWIGCQKVSPGCDHCYAETLSNRYGWAQWGPHGERKRTSAANWRKPLQWAKTLPAKLGRRPRVFCASLADVFDNQIPPEWRADLFSLIIDTPELDWLLLTKRPENIERMCLEMIGGDVLAALPANIWLGSTCEDQPAYDRRWPILSALPARIRFISYEPAIGPLQIEPLAHKLDAMPDWIICGGESGHGARMMMPHWAYALQEECRRMGVYFFMKQMTGKKPIPDDLLIRQFPRFAP